MSLSGFYTWLRFCLLLILALPPGLIRKGTGQLIRAAQAASTSHRCCRQSPSELLDEASEEYLFNDPAGEAALPGAQVVGGSVKVWKAGVVRGEITAIWIYWTEGSMLKAAKAGKSYSP